MLQAVRSLAAARDPAAISTLIKVLAYNNPGAAVAATDGLVSLGAAAVPALLAQLDGYNYSARAWAIRALALIQDPRALPVLLETAQGDFALSVRRAAAKGIGVVDWVQLPAAEIEPAQASALETLIAVLADPEWVVRYAAVVGLEALTQTLAARASQDCPRAMAALRASAAQDAVLAVQARAQLALNTLQAGSEA